MSVQGFRSGQWVKWSDSIKDAYVAKDGKTVGIFCTEHRDPLGQLVPTSIVPVDVNGNNIMVIIDGAAFPMRIGPNQKGLVPLLDKTDMPPGRVIDPNWSPKP